MLKDLVNEFKGVLRMIYNRSKSENKTPHDCKIADVTHIFEKGKSARQATNDP